jgi:hypothetical protein
MQHPARYRRKYDVRVFSCMDSYDIYDEWGICGGWGYCNNSDIKKAYENGLFFT